METLPNFLSFANSKNRKKILYIWLPKNKFLVPVLYWISMKAF
jgi:hypothetical protein